MMIMLLASIAVSAALLALLCLGDPKRRRSMKLSGDGQGATTRRLWTVVSLLPGLAFVLWGDAAAFLLWLGGYAVVGWLVTLGFSAWAKKVEGSR
jgi:cobalamin synthase